MYQIDQKVRDIKSQMTALIYKRNPDATYEDIEKVFSRFDN